MRSAAVVVGLLLVLTTISSSADNQLRPFLAGAAFIARFQDPVNCTGHAYSVVEAGFGGGFASQFQVVAVEWLKAAVGHNYSVPVLIRGHLRGYSDGRECSHVAKDWTCLFLPMSACQETLLAHGRRVDWAPGTGKVAVDASVVPAEFRDRGLAWWWGTVQAYMFRLQPAVERYIHDELAHMNHSFPALGSPVAGLHVRHGDKASDGFKHQSFEAELRAVRKSPDCVQVVAAAAVGNNSSGAAASAAGADSSTRGEISNVGNVEGSGGEVASCMTHAGSSNTTALVPLKVFVASDDANVLVAAKKMGHLADSSGVSQQTSTKGMFATMLARPDIGYNASLEIVRCVSPLWELLSVTPLLTPSSSPATQLCRSRTSTSCPGARPWWASRPRRSSASPWASATPRACCVRPSRWTTTRRRASSA